MTPCWTWVGSTRGGYGRTWIEGRHQSIHRYVWEQRNGKIPDGHEIHHICANKVCYNPMHLSLVTKQWHANNDCWHKTVRLYCVKGHYVVGDNVRVNKQGKRLCRECDRFYALRNYRLNSGNEKQRERRRKRAEINNQHSIDATRSKISVEGS